MRRDPTQRLVQFFLGATLLFCGCADKQPGGAVPVATCAADADCESGLTCRSGRCRLPCSEGCPPGTSCAAGVCYPKDCPQDACAAGEVCLDDRCASPDCGGKVCASGSVCVAGACYPKDCPQHACGAGEVCTGDRCGSPDCGGRTCQRGLRCEGNTCVECSSDTDCPGLRPRCHATTRACVECVGPTDCPAGVCAENRCLPSTCGDRVKNGRESDVDCGGDCAPCGPARLCGAGADCQSGVCAGKVCQAPTCGDKVKNGREADVDCGGACPPCAPGKACDGPADCQSGICTASACQAPTCTDKAKNGAETDLDCGGSCPPCPSGKGCAAGTDCQSLVCAGSVCRMPTCIDTVKNGAESDVDCGGTCTPCPAGKTCSAGSDCESAVCASTVCQAPTCTDSAKNGTESDVDCGGSCPPCAPGKSCREAKDCSSLDCNDRCAAPPATCKELLKRTPSAPSGKYVIDPDGISGPVAPFSAYCDMITDGGGWTLIGSWNEVNMRTDQTNACDTLTAYCNITMKGWATWGYSDLMHKWSDCPAAYGTYTRATHEADSGACFNSQDSLNIGLAAPAGRTWWHEGLKIWNDCGGCCGGFSELMSHSAPFPMVTSNHHIRVTTGLTTFPTYSGNVHYHCPTGWDNLYLR